MDKIEISADSREIKGKGTKNLLKEGFVPGVVYGHKFDNVLIQIGKKEFSALLKNAGESSLIDLKIGGKEIGNVIIKDYDRDPESGAIIHFDLHKIKMSEKIITNVNLNFVGESSAVKNDGGILVTVRDQIEIKCLPKDLLQEIEIDLSRLEKLDDVIRIKDLQLSDVIEILDEEESVIVSVTPPRTDKEMENLEEKPEESIEKVEGAVKEEPAVKEEEKK